MDDFIAKGLKDLPEDRASINKLCQWNKPAKRKTEPKTIHSIRIVKQEPRKVLKGRETLASLKYDPRQQAHRQGRGICTSIDRSSWSCKSNMWIHEI